MKQIRRQAILIILSLFIAIILCSTVSAADLNVTIGSWERSGLDSNNVNVGPNQTLVQVRVHNNDTTTAHEVNASFSWTSSNSYINLAPGETTTRNLGDIAPGEIKDAFFLVEIARNDNAYSTERNYTVNVAGSDTPTYNRNNKIYVDHLISQSRNRINSITTSNPNPSPGQIFTITVVGETASATYDTVTMPLVNYNPASIRPLNVTTYYDSTSTGKLKIDNPGDTNFISVWTFIALAPGSQTLYSYIHDFSGVSDHYNSNYGDDCVQINVTNKADLAIQKTVCNCAAVVGNNIHFYITATNNGPSNATGVIVKDTLPSYVTFISATPPTGVSVVGNLLTWTIGSLNVGESLTLDVLVKIVQAGNFTNTANITGNEYDPDLSNNQDTVSVNSVQPTADLSISKTINDLNPHIGDTITFFITVTNDGPDDATGVIVSDTLPAGLIDITLGTYSLGTASLIGNILTWNIGNLAHEASATLELSAVVNQTGAIINTANVTGTTYDPNLNNNNSTVTLQGQPVADLSITKEVNDNEVSQGDTVVFTIRVTNNGPNTATNIRITDLWPLGLGNPILNTGVFPNPSLGTWSFNPYSGDPLYSGLLSWNITSLAAGQSATLTINATANQIGQIKNIVSVIGDEFDPITSNNQACACISVNETHVPVANLAIQKVTDITMPHIEDIVTFTVYLTNNGPDRATNVRVVDPIPAGLNYIIDSVSASVGNVNYISGALIWDNFGLNVGQSVNMTFKVNTTATGFITNFVTANSTNSENVTDAVTIEVLPKADIGVDKIVTPEIQNYGQLITHIITVTNYGPSDATGVQVTDLLPDMTSLIYISDNPSQGTFDPVIGIWQIGNITNGQSATIEIVFRIAKTGIIENTATKTYQNEYDPNTSNDSDNASVQVPPAADLSITKTVSNPRPYIHETITSTLVVQNHGPNAAYNVYVEDKLPDGLKYISSSANYGNYDPETGIWTIGYLPGGAIAVLNIQTSVEKIGPIENHAHVYSSTFDPILNNQAATASVDVQAIPVKAATVPMQPTGMPVAYLLAAVMMVLAGLFAPKRK